MSRGNDVIFCFSDNQPVYIWDSIWSRSNSSTLQSVCVCVCVCVCARSLFLFLLHYIDFIRGKRLALLMFFEYQ